MPNEATTYISPPAIAKRYGVSVRKVIGWIDRGDLIALNLAENPNGKRPRYRVRLADLEAFEQRRASLGTGEPVAEGTNNG